MRQDSTSIAVFGEALVDDFGASQVVGGAPFNVARHLAAFGAAPLMLTRIGADANGAAVRAQAARFGMREDGIQVDALRPTGRVLVEQEGGTHRFTILPEQAYDHIDAGALLASLRACTPAMLYFGTLAQRGPVSQAALGSLLAASAAPRFLDLNLRSGQVSAERVLASMREADILKLNDEELLWVLAALGRAGMNPDEAAPACADLIAEFSLGGVVLTLGARGAAWFGADGERLEAAPAACPALVDTVGAGDAFSAVFLLGRLRGWELAATLARANAFAAAICAIRGAVPADPAWYAPWRAEWLRPEENVA
ncbi:PfkB family carbohydrate kinase [Massilia sp. DD77]|uniref:PfkB family carbohydrate kinase n=1 Tax=Massilia sp. DD77 TaxID=3109349 RepID=UPI002FFF8001